MRTYWATLFVLSTCLAHAQNWALLNPAYRYNYSNDGTDTISNQIRVMDVDTLGVDSFRYEMNLIGVVCDTCPASMGGPCDGCFVRVNQPQFLGYECVRSGNEWLFNGADTFLIHSDAGVGAWWMFNAAEAIIATVDAEWAEEVFGVPDTLQRILLSDGDMIILSRSFGIISISHVNGHFDLIGVEGPGAGRLLPDALDYFNYSVGDELVYRVSCTYQINPQGGFPYPSMRSHYWKAIITGRSDANDSITYSTSSARTFPDLPWTSTYECTWPMPNAEWTVRRTDINKDHPILSAYPGQVLDTSVCWAPWGGGELTRYLANVDITDEGRMRLRSRHLGSMPSDPAAVFHLTDQVAAGTFPLQIFPFEVLYEEGIGLVNMLYIESNPIGQKIELVGAILSGDTIIPPPTINWAVGMEESSPDARMLYPNPADQTCFISGVIGSEQARVHDLEGRLVLTTQLTADRAALDVSRLAPGTYVVNTEGMRPQRLIIAR